MEMAIYSLLGLIVILVVTAVTVSLVKGRPPGRPLTIGSIPVPSMGALTGWWQRHQFVGNAAMLIFALVLVDFVLVQSGWGSWWMLLAYVPLMLVLAMREAATREGTKKVLTVLAFIGFAAAGLSHLPWFKACDADCQLRKQEAAAAQARIDAQRRIAAERAYYPGCDRQRKKYVFGENWVRINPQGSCAPDLFYAEQDVTLWARQGGDTKPLGPIHRGDPLPVDTEWVQSEGKTFNAFVELSPPRKTQWFR